MDTVNSELFARFYFRETSQIRSFVRIKHSQNGEITLSVSDVGKSCSSREFECAKYVVLSYSRK